MQNLKQVNEEQNIRITNAYATQTAQATDLAIKDSEISASRATQTPLSNRIAELQATLTALSSSNLLSSTLTEDRNTAFFDDFESGSKIVWTNDISFTTTIKDGELVVDLKSPKFIREIDFTTSDIDNFDMTINFKSITDKVWFAIYFRIMPKGISPRFAMNISGDNRGKYWIYEKKKKKLEESSIPVSEIESIKLICEEVTCKFIINNNRDLIPAISGFTMERGKFGLGFGGEGVTTIEDITIKSIE